MYSMQKQLLTLLTLCLFVGLWSCQTNTNITITGQFHGVVDKNIVLEELSPSGTKIIDSTRSSSEGIFSFTITNVNENPTFYNVSYNGSFVPLLLTASENVHIDAVGNIYNNYVVEGSEGSLKMRELSRLTLTQSQSLDSISRLYETASDPEQAADFGRAYGSKYIMLKRSVIGFVIKNASSLASIVPLYQPVFGSKFIFDEPSDIVYFRVVADSLAKHYPTSPYVTSLQNDLRRVNDAFALDSLVSNSGNTPQEVLPDLSIKDAAGIIRSLSKTRGKVVLLDFTSYSTPEFKQLNKELLSSYNKFSGRGFEIYQVCVDQDKATWIQSTIDARLPWITVNDFMGRDSRALLTFNIREIPTRILIDRQGSIIGRNLYNRDLDEAIDKAL
ncbi:MAG: TlpA disulfide reductase family protein [Mucinivorans sp.]